MSEYIATEFDLASTEFIGEYEQIIRCRDCRNYHPDEGRLMRCRFEIDGFVQWRNAEANGFCAWGERRGDA